MVSPESIHKINITRTEQVILSGMYVYTQTYMHRIAISDKRGHKFEKVQARLEFRGRKQKKAMLYLYYNIKFKIKQNKNKPQLPCVMHNTPRSSMKKVWKCVTLSALRSFVKTWCKSPWFFLAACNNLTIWKQKLCCQVGNCLGTF